MSTFTMSLPTSIISFTSTLLPPGGAQLPRVISTRDHLDLHEREGTLGRACMLRKISTSESFRNRPARQRRPWFLPSSLSLILPVVTGTGQWVELGWPSPPVAGLPVADHSVVGNVHENLGHLKGAQPHWDLVLVCQVFDGNCLATVRRA